MIFIIHLQRYLILIKWSGRGLHQKYAEIYLQKNQIKNIQKGQNKIYYLIIYKTNIIYL